MYGKKKNFNRISDDVVKEKMVVVVLEGNYKFITFY